MKAILIAEKPSLMREIQAAYNENRSAIPFEIDFLSQAGHLVGLKLPNEINEDKYGKWHMDNFPIDVPYQYKISEGKRELVTKIRSAVKSGIYDFIIHAGDPDQEGELLINLVLDYIGNELPVKRFWTNDITHGAIVKALQNLKDDSEYVNIYNAALTRQHADYQFGMNITGVATLKMGELYKLGRVKAPIIKMIVDRELAIRNFVEKSTWKRAFSYMGCEFVNAEEYEEEAQALSRLPQTTSATITNVKDEIKNYKAPKLYKLSTLQSDAYKKLGFSGAQTLETLQHLYEAKLVSYPRTDCEYISSAVDLQGIIKATSTKFGYDAGSFTNHIDFIKKDSSYVNDKAIATEGHTAIIPTGEGSLGGFGERERALYELIVRRFLAIFAEPKQVRNLSVTAIPDSDASLGDYIFKESSDINPGYELVLNPTYEMKKGKGLSFSKDQTLNPVDFHIKECISKPPVRYNDGSLIKALDNPEEYKDDDNKKVTYSIGTPATRANIIEECIQCGYFTKEKGVFIPTAKAERIIEELGDVALFSVTNSGRWENLLDQIRHGELNAKKVEMELLKECQASTVDIKNRNIKKASSPIFSKASPALGKCPHCGEDVIDGKFGPYCSGKCGMQISKAMGKTLTKMQIKSLLSGKKILMKDLTSKTGKKYSAYLTPVGVESFSYKGNDGSVKQGYGFKFQMDYAN